jgi:DNA repair protein RadC
VVDRYATVELVVHKEEQLPNQAGFPALLDRWGLAAQTQEAFWVIAYDASMNVRTVVETARGGYAKVDVHIPAVMTAVITAGADRFRVAHNHPGGDVTPTDADIRLTQAIMVGANQLGLYLEDHHIVGPNGKHFSFRDNGMMIPAPYTGEASTKR